MDSIYVDNKVPDWSVRIYSVLKSQRLDFIHKPSDKDVVFYPNNVIGAGIGASFRNLVIDMGINLDLNRENPSGRFDLQGDLIWKYHFVNFFTQRYRGLQPTGELAFREDLRTRVNGLTYNYLFNARKLSIAAILTGTTIQRKSVGSFGAGGFAGLVNIKADSAILAIQENGYSIKDFNESNAFLIGLNGLYGHVFTFPGSLFLFTSISPGIGIQVHDVKAGDWYRPEQPIIFKFQSRLAMGYSGQKFYLLANFTDERFSYPLSNVIGNSLDVIKMKLLAGFRF
jgi:hypothetical protein